MVGQIDMQPDQTRAIVARATTVLSQVLRTATDLKAVFPPPGAFGQIGQAAEAASTQARDQISQTVQALGNMLQTLHNKVLTAANTTSQWDQNSAQALGGAPGAPAANPSQAQPQAQQPSTPPPQAQPQVSQPAPATPAVATPVAAPAGPGSLLGAAVHQAGLGQPAEPHSVEHILNDLAAVNGPSAAQPPASALSSPAGFAAWLTPQNQASVGLVQVNTGATALPGLQPGDVVVGSVTPGDPIVGIVGDDGNLYNGGPVGSVSALSGVQGVYRPISAQSTLWGTTA